MLDPNMTLLYTALIGVAADLSEDATSEVVQGRALFGLVKTERNRGELLKAEKALRRLEREHPELVIQLN